MLTSISADGPDVLEDDIRTIAMPTLVIGHARDAVHPLSFAKTLVDWIPNASFAEITPKAVDPHAYRRDFKVALTRFLTAGDAAIA